MAFIKQGPAYINMCGHIRYRKEDIEAFEKTTSPKKKDTSNRKRRCVMTSKITLSQVPNIHIGKLADLPADQLMDLQKQAADHFEKAKGLKVD